MLRCPSVLVKRRVLFLLCFRPVFESSGPALLRFDFFFFFFFFFSLPLFFWIVLLLIISTRNNSTSKKKRETKERGLMIHVCRVDGKVVVGVVVAPPM
jgi:hypothetical protein